MAHWFYVASGPGPMKCYIDNDHCVFATLKSWAVTVYHGLLRSTYNPIATNSPFALSSAPSPKRPPPTTFPIKSEATANYLEKQHCRRTATGYLAGTQMVKIVLSVIVAIPGLMVAVESGFQYSTRVKMNTDAIYTLYDFIGRLGQGDDPFAVSKDFNAYMRRYGRDFPSGSASPRLNIATTGKGPGTAAR